MKSDNLVPMSSRRSVPEELLQKDLQDFRAMAVEWGATAAEVIPASLVVVQERVWLKCLVPRCRMAGHTPYCPPNTPQPDFVRKALGQYQWAVVLKKEVRPLEDFVARSQEHAREDADRFTQATRRFHRDTMEITGRVESYAQSRGYDLAMGFSGGCCNMNLCAGVPCAVMKGENCRHALKARPSMEAMGIDVFDLVTRVGWEVHMVRRYEPKVDEIPYGLSVGIVFIY